MRLNENDFDTVLEAHTNYAPHEYQLEIHQMMAEHRFGVLVCHRRFGKTLCALNALIHAAAFCTKSEGRFGYVAPFLKQSKQIAWLYLKKFGLLVPGAKVHEGELYIEFPNGARITLYGADNADAMRGLYFDGVVLDEYAQFKPGVWDEVMRPQLADRKGWALFIGTPHGIDKFYEVYQFAQSKESRGLWFHKLYRADETDLPWLDQEELAMARAAMSDNAYRQEFLCDFTASSDDILITIDMVSRATRRVVDERELEGYAKIIGVDVARYGDDRSVIQRRHGPVAYEPDVYQGLDNMQLAGRVAALIDEWGADAVFIDGGRGEGVIDRLRQLGYTVIEVHFGGKSSDPHYFDKRSEMWCLMKDWIEQVGALPNITEMKTDLCVPQYDIDTGLMRLESKKKIKERGMKSPDLGDALALTFAIPVAAPARLGHRERPAAQAISEYDPHSY